MKQAFWSNPWFFVPALLFLNIGLGLLLFVPQGHEIISLNPLRTEPLNTIFRWSTRLGEGPVFIVIGLVSMLWRYRYAVLLALAGLIIIPTSHLLKEQMRKERPVAFFAGAGLKDAVVLVPKVDVHSGRTSFPSGHTMAAFGLFGVIALLGGGRMPWLGFTCALAATLAGISRIFLVQHFLPDVLAGAFVGLFITGLVWEVNVRWLQRWKGLDRGILSKRAERHTP